MFSKLTAATMTLAAVASIVCSVQPVTAQNVSAAGQAEIRQSLDNIQNKITRARAEGRLSAGDAASLQSRLSQCNTMFSTAIADGNISAQERAMIKQEISALNADTRLNINVYRGSGNPGAPITTTSLTSQSELKQSIDDIQSRITRARSSGAISASDAASLQARLDQCNSMFRTCTIDGNVNSRERILLQQNLNSLSSDSRLQILSSGGGRWNNDRRDDRRDWNDNGGVSVADITARRQELSDRIARLSQNGRLSRHEVSKLQRELDKNVALEAKFKMSGGRMGHRERQVIMDDLEKLAVQIRAESRDNDYGRGNHNWRNN